MSANTLIGLNRYVTCWKGRLIQSAFADLLEGMRREQQRLDGKRFLVSLFRQEYDIDGLTEYINLIEGFNDLNEAKEFADREASDPSDLSEAAKDWPLVECDTLGRLSRIRPPVSNIEQVYYRGFKVDGGWCTSAYFHFEVLKIPTDSVITEALFDYLNCEAELTHYFIEIGKRFRKP